MKKAILFDLDGTLWDTAEQVGKVWAEVAEKYSLAFDKSRVKEIMGMTQEEMVTHFFERDPERGKAFITECLREEVVYLAKYGGNIYENTIETVKELSKSFKLYIISNCQEGYIEAFLDFYDLREYFEDYENSGRTGRDKAHNIKLIMERNGIHDAVYVGDTQKDFLSASKNRVRFIWAKYGFGTCEHYDAAIDDISELVKLKALF